jgi:hypothetical protein
MGKHAEAAGPIWAAPPRREATGASSGREVSPPSGSHSAGSSAGAALPPQRRPRSAYWPTVDFSVAPAAASVREMFVPRNSEERSSSAR